MLDQMQLWRRMASDHVAARGNDIGRSLQHEHPLFWWYADVASPNRFRTAGNSVTPEFIYWEIYYTEESFTWTVIGAVFGKRRENDPLIQSFVVNSPQAAGEGAHDIAFDIIAEHIRHTYTCNIAVHISNSGMYRIRSASIKVVQAGPTDRPDESAILKNVFENFVTDTSVTDEEIKGCCPMCWGDGFTATFAIPDEDYKSGLSGYALWSCNRVNGAVACTYCGGHGERFEEWYLNEDPQRRAALASYRAGTGRFQAQRPAAYGRIDSGGSVSALP